MTHSNTLECLLERGFVRRIGGLPGDIALFEVTPEGMAAAAEDEKS
jgi:hypothetical protein